ncbi:MAG TPA: hypothetical protein VHY20_02305, partial [Pirellulales bacterium]|nr:hypothetical protein [Pirellulales bacterium]
IDYAALAVRKAIVEKFPRDDLADLQVIAGEKTLSIEHGDRVSRGTRDSILAVVRQAASYDNLWQLLPH